MATSTPTKAYTPGPWRVGEDFLMNDGARPVASSTKQSRIALVDCQVLVKRGEGWKTESEERDANAHLIAAAPEMLEALERIIEVRNERDKVLMIAEAAIQKAHGQ